MKWVLFRLEAVKEQYEDKQKLAVKRRGGLIADRDKDGGGSSYYAA